MSDARTIRIDPKDYRLDWRLMKRIGRLAKPYWADVRHWKSWFLMAFTILIGPAWAYYNFRIAQITAVQANALVARDQEQWRQLFWLFLGLAIGRWVYDQLLALCIQLMKMQWYGWMTDWMVERYLSSKTYYDIATRDDIDNPDERIQDNVLPFIEAVVGFPGMVLGTVLNLITNGVLISQVSSSMTMFVIVYSTFSLVLQTVIFWPLIRKNFDQVAAYADFRFGLLRVRDNAETIAFFRGEVMERAQVASRIRRVIRNQMSIYYYTLKTGVLTRAMEDVWTIAPLFIIYPLYFSGKIEFGIIALATSASVGLRGSITSLNTYIPFLAGIAPRVVRLAQIVERFDELEHQATRREGNITIVRDNRISLDSVCFQTPGGEQQLAQNVSIEMFPKESLIIIGQTGVGKSSILRSMAGLWTRGSGTMTMPPAEDTMFVPQRPYMMLGDLRTQLLYPHGRADMTDEELQAVLERVCLPDLVETCGGFDADRDWSKVLSLGEQQRVSFARILISKPKFVFLDESTSAIDIPTEAKLYQALVDEGVTFVSVGHRETILRFHDRALRLLPGGRWEILNAHAIEPTLIKPLGSERAGGGAETIAGDTLAKSQ